MGEGAGEGRKSVEGKANKDKLIRMKSKCSQCYAQIVIVLENRERSVGRERAMTAWIACILLLPSGGLGSPNLAEPYTEDTSFTWPFSPSLTFSSWKGIKMRFSSRVWQANRSIARKGSLNSEKRQQRQQSSLTRGYPRLQYMSGVCLVLVTVSSSIDTAETKTCRNLCFHICVYSSVTHVSKSMEPSKISINRRLDKENVLYNIQYTIYNGVLSHLKNTKIISFARKCVGLQIIPLSKNRLDRKTNSMSSLICNI